MGACIVGWLLPGIGMLHEDDGSADEGRGNVGKEHQTQTEAIIDHKETHIQADPENLSQHVGDTQHFQLGQGENGLRSFWQFIFEQQPGDDFGIHPVIYKTQYQQTTPSCLEL